MGATKEKGPSTALARVEPKALAAKDSTAIGVQDKKDVAAQTAQDSYKEQYESAQLSLSTQIQSGSNRFFYIETDERLFNNTYLNLLTNGTSNQIVVYVNNYRHHRTGEDILREVVGRLTKHGAYRVHFENLHENRQVTEHRNSGAISKLGKFISRKIFKEKQPDIFQEYDDRYVLERVAIEGNSASYKASQGTSTSEKVQFAAGGGLDVGSGSKVEKTTQEPASDKADNKNTTKAEATTGVTFKANAQHTSEVIDTITHNRETTGSIVPYNALKLADLICLFLNTFTKKYPDMKTVFLFEGNLGVYETPTFIEAINQISDAKNTFVVAKVPLPAPAQVARGVKLITLHGPPSTLHQLRSAVDRNRRASIISLSLILVLMATLGASTLIRQNKRPTSQANVPPKADQAIPASEADKPSDIPVTPPQVVSPAPQPDNNIAETAKPSSKVQKPKIKTPSPNPKKKPPPIK